MGLALNAQSPPLAISVAAPALTVGRFLRHRRELAGLSLRGLARRLEAWHLPGAPWWGIAAWERGVRTPSLRQVATIATELQLTRVQVGQLLELACVRAPAVRPSVGIYRWHPSTPPVGVLVRRRRAELHWSAAELARRLCRAGLMCSEDAVLRWEKGQRGIGLTEFVELALVLELDAYTVGLALGRAAGCAPAVVAVAGDYTPSTDRPAVLDLARRHHDAVRVARRTGNYRKALEAGWDRDDLEQEFLARLQARQARVWTAYDPARAGVGTYLWRVASSLLSHLAAERRTLAGRLEAPGARLVRDGELALVDAAEVAVDVDAAPVDEELELDEVRRQVVAEVDEELGWQAGQQAAELLAGRAEAPKAVREAVRRALEGRIDGRSAEGV